MILAYLRERFRLTCFGPLAIILAVGALGRPASVGEITLAAAGGLFLLAQFRIWDDFADRRNDAIAHPHRVLVRATKRAPLIGLGMALLTINVGIATQHDATFLSILLLGTLHVALGAYYLVRKGRTVVGDQLLLAKYPAFVCILAGARLLESPRPVAIAAVIVYAAASAYEAWHDPISPLAQLIGGRS